jgi:hypothetical protein
MSFDTDMSDIKDWKTKCYERVSVSDIGEEEAERRTIRVPFMAPSWQRDGDDIVRMHPVTHALLWGAMNICMSDITEKNAMEVLIRHRMMAQIYGAPLSTDDGDYFLTLGDVRNHIGMKTNATDMSAAKFKGEIARRVRQQASDAIAKAKGGAK